ncbi:hypothetical protein BT96DRAFT_1004858 [Gymnopus androsaceus JB14]|uniref:Mid2 domain-containing protein n=1 Tax=Gymnopus androsaceus JB14 TaxID=1447944 RepID=A0A6A4GQ22_9AGAR|nr:hypothetical protein BT96DRAFT_1004858 [Gymnopus androsaceus JB14]
MRSSHLVFLSLGTVVAGFSFTGLPSTATVNIATSGTLIRDSSDPTAFSLLLRLVTQNGGSTIQTFSSEEETSIPFTFTPTESGSFIIEVISNLTPISDTTEPDQIFASSSEFTVSEPDNQASPPSITSSSSKNAGTSSSSQNVNTVTSSSSSTAVQTTTTANNNNGQGESTSTSTSTTSLQTSSTHSTSAAVAGAASSTNAASVTTNAFASQSTGTSAKGALGSASGSPTATSSSGTPSDSSDTSGSGSSNGSPPVSKSTITSPPGSTGTLAPNSAASKSTNTGMIVGIILGVLAFVAVSMALLLAFIRRRRRQRTNTFKRQLMTRQTRSSPLVFNMVSPPPSTTAESGDGFCEYNPDSDNGHILETGTVAQSDMSYRQSAYSNSRIQK